MDNLIILVGDSSAYLGEHARKIDKKAYLINLDNIDDCHHGVVYTSIGDLGLEKFITFLSNATEIKFCPPLNGIWTDKGNIHTKYSMAWLSMYYCIIISTIKSIPLHNTFKDEYKFAPTLPKPRISNSANLWIAGCSTTAAVAIDKNQVWWKPAEKYLNLPVVDLSRNGSSISYDSDQLLRADLKKGDKIIWGLTTSERFYWYSKNSIAMVNSGHYRLNKEFGKIIPQTVLLEDHWSTEALASVYRLENVCNKIGIDLLMVGIHANIEINAMLCSKSNYIIVNGMRGLDWDSDFLDFGTDGSHPGPLTHKKYSRKVLDRIKQLGW